MNYFTVARSAVEQEKDVGRRNVKLVLGWSVSIVLQMGTQRSDREEQTDCVWWRRMSRGPVARPGRCVLADKVPYWLLFYLTCILKFIHTM